MAEEVKAPDIKDIKWMDLNEFVNKGFLVEVNRRFFHPLGLALSVAQGKTDGKIMGFAGVQDFRDAPGGVSFGIREWESEGDEKYWKFLQGKIMVNSEMTKRAGKREKELGSVIEDATPINPKSEMAKKWGL